MSIVHDCATFWPVEGRLGQGRVKVGEKRLCRLLCGKPLAFRRSPPPFIPPLGWKAQPSSRATGISQGAGPGKGKAFPHSRRQSRYGMLPFAGMTAASSAQVSQMTPVPQALEISIAQ